MSGEMDIDIGLNSKLFDQINTPLLTHAATKSPGDGMPPAAKLEVIIAYLTSPHEVNYEALSEFFMSYRLFASPIKVWQLLASRLLNAAERATRTGATSEVGKNIGTRCYVALNFWISKFFETDFAPNLLLRVTAAKSITALSGCTEFVLDSHFARILNRIRLEWDKNVSKLWELPEVVVGNNDFPTPWGFDPVFPKQKTNEVSFLLYGGIQIDADIGVPSMKSNYGLSTDGNKPKPKISSLFRGSNNDGTTRIKTEVVLHDKVDMLAVKVLDEFYKSMQQMVSSYNAEMQGMPQVGTAAYTPEQSPSINNAHMGGYANDNYMQALASGEGLAQPMPPFASATPRMNSATTQQSAEFSINPQDEQQEFNESQLAPNSQPDYNESYASTQPEFTQMSIDSNQRPLPTIYQHRNNMNNFVMKFDTSNGSTDASENYDLPRPLPRIDTNDSKGQSDHSDPNSAPNSATSLAASFPSDLDPTPIGSSASGSNNQAKESNTNLAPISSIAGGAPLDFPENLPAPPVPIYEHSSVNSAEDNDSVLITDSFTDSFLNTTEEAVEEAPNSAGISESGTYVDNENVHLYHEPETNPSPSKSNIALPQPPQDTIEPSVNDELDNQTPTPESQSPSQEFMEQGAEYHEETYPDSFDDHAQPLDFNDGDSWDHVDFNKFDVASYSGSSLSSVSQQTINGDRISAPCTETEAPMESEYEAQAELPANEPATPTESGSRPIATHQDQSNNSGNKRESDTMSISLLSEIDNSMLKPCPGYTQDDAERLKSIPDVSTHGDALEATLRKLEGRSTAPPVLRHVQTLPNLHTTNQGLYQNTLKHIHSFNNLENEVSKLQITDFRNDSSAQEDSYREEYGDSYDYGYDLGAQDQASTQLNSGIQDPHLYDTPKPQIFNRPVSFIDRSPHVGDYTERRNKYLQTNPVNAGFAPPMLSVGLPGSTHAPFVLAYTALEVAEQMTIIDREIVSQIDFFEMIEIKSVPDLPNCISWLSIVAGAHTQIPGLNLVLSRAKLVANWVFSEIFMCPTPALKAQTFSRFTYIALESLKLQNMSTVTAILTGLGSLLSQEIIDMQTLSLLSDNEKVTYGKLSLLIDSNDDFGKLRGAHRILELERGAVPDVQLFVNDLVLAAAAQSMNSEEEINFTKYRMGARIVKALRQQISSGSNYNLAINTGLLSKCLYLAALSNEELNATC